MVVIVFIVFHFVPFLVLFHRVCVENSTIASASMCTASNESAFWVFDFDPSEFCGFYCATMHLWVHFYSRFSDSKYFHLRALMKIVAENELLNRSHKIRNMHSAHKHSRATKICFIVMWVSGRNSQFSVHSWSSSHSLTRTIHSVLGFSLLNGHKHAH